MIRGYADFPCRLENFKVLKHKSVPGLIYNLCGIIVVDKNSDCPYASSYMKCGNKWYRLSFVEGRVEVSEKVVYDVCQKFNESSTLLYSCQSEDRV